MRVLTVEKTVYKAGVAVLNLGAAVAAANLLHGDTLKWTVQGAAFLTVFLVWLAPFATKQTLTDEPEPIVTPVTVGAHSTPAAPPAVVPTTVVAPILPS